MGKRSSMHNLWSLPGGNIHRKDQSSHLHAQLGLSSMPVFFLPFLRVHRPTALGPVSGRRSSQRPRTWVPSYDLWPYEDHVATPQMTRNQTYYLSVRMAPLVDKSNSSHNRKDEFCRSSVTASQRVLGTRTVLWNNCKRPDRNRLTEGTLRWHLAIFGRFVVVMINLALIQSQGVTKKIIRTIGSSSYWRKAPIAPFPIAILLSLTGGSCAEKSALVM